MYLYNEIQLDEPYFTKLEKKPVILIMKLFII